MKKIILIIICILLLCGCTKDEFTEYDHYDLTNYNHNIYSYSRNSNSTMDENYAVSILTPKDKEDLEGYDEGVFYEVRENDYILLDSFSGSNNQYDQKGYTMWYKDKLYIIRNMSPVVFEYNLNKENTKRKDLIFDLSDIMNAESINYVVSMIEDVDDDYIYLESSVSGYNGEIPVDDRRGIHLKCSLKDYKCIELK